MSSIIIDQGPDDFGEEEIKNQDDLPNQREVKDVKNKEKSFDSN